MRSALSVNSRRIPAGFTLIEIVIVIVVVSILMAIALPSYQNSMNKGRRADAKAGLMDAANRQERFMLDRSIYSDDMQNLGFGADPANSAERHYAIDVEPEDPNCPIESCYLLKAIPVAGGIQNDDVFCTSFFLKSTGEKTAEGSTPDECW